MTKSLKQAIDEGKAKAKPGQWRDSFATWDRQWGMTEVICRCCGHTIARTMPVGPQKIVKIGRKTIVQEAMQMAYLANYREVLLEMSDGGKHVGNICVDCVEDLSDPATLQAFYAMDLSQWNGRGAVLPQAFLDRAPVRVLRVADYIEE